MRNRSTLTGWLILACLPCLVLLTQCDLVDPVAPAGSTMNLYANPTTISIIGGVSELTAVITEEDGYPVSDGTVVEMVSDLGTLESNRMTTSNGRVTNFLYSGGVGGTATITAYSGVLEAETATVEIGISPGAVVVSGDPQFLPPGGGESVIKAVVFDEDFVPMPSVSVSITTSAGVLQSGGSPLVTDANGTVYDLLTTDETADITASVADSVTGETTIVVDDRYADTIFLTVNPGTVNSCEDNEDHVEVIAYCLDPSGFPAEGAFVVFELEGVGWISDTSGTANSNGEVKITFGLTDSNCYYCGSGNSCSAKITARSGPDVSATADIQIDLN